MIDCKVLIMVAQLWCSDTITERGRMSSAVLLHRLEEGAEGELSAPAARSTQSGFLRGLFFSVLLRSLLILNKRNNNK